MCDKMPPVPRFGKEKLMTLNQSSAIAHRSAVLAIVLPLLFGIAIQAARADDNKKESGAAYAVSQRIYKSGETSRYRLTVKIQTPGPMGDQDVTIQLKLRETARAAKVSTGEWSLVQQFETGTVNLGGQEQDVLGLLPIVTLTRDKRGLVTMSTAGGTPDGAAELGGLLLQITNAARDFAPDKAVKIGDKWKASFTNPSKIMGGTMVEADTELLDTETIEGIKTLKIRFKGTSQNAGDAETAPIEGTVNVEPETGRLVRITEKGAGTFAGGKAKADLEMTLITKEDKASK
jgi:hypothetical protein